MSYKTNFGELALRSPPESIDDIDSDNQNGFSTIDLDGVQTPKTSDSMEINEILENESNKPNSIKVDTSYTSFGEALSSLPNNGSKLASKVCEVSKASSPKQLPTSESITSNDFVHVKSAAGYPGSTNGSTVSPTSMLSSASDVSAKLATKTASTIESFRLWGKSAYKCTRQIVSEKLGKSSRTIDPELDVMIDNLRETKKKYEAILQFSRNLAIHFSNIMQSQRYLTDTFADLAQKSPELITEFTSNAETQRHLIKHGEHLLNAISHFSNSLSTLCEKTMEDTFLTIRNYEAARLEYDAYRLDLEYLKSLPENRNNEVATLEHDVSIYKERYGNLKKDVQIKIKFLDENRVKVMRKQLNQFQFAIAVYFSGNHEALEQTMRQFRERRINEGSSSSMSSPESFLEH